MHSKWKESCKISVHKVHTFEGKHIFANTIFLK